MCVCAFLVLMLLWGCLFWKVLIRMAAVKTAGLFRISGSSTTIFNVRDSLNRGTPAVSASIAFSHVPTGVDVELGLLDDHVVSGLLKLWLRHLPDPLIPFSFYDAFSNVLSQRTWHLAASSFVLRS